MKRIDKSVSDHFDDLEANEFETAPSFRAPKLMTFFLCFIIALPSMLATVFAGGGWISALVIYAALVVGMPLALAWFKLQIAKRRQLVEL